MFLSTLLGDVDGQVDDDMQQHDQLLAVIEENPSEMDRIVAHRRQDFTGDFFKHLNILCDACYENLDRRDGMVNSLYFSPPLSI
jgi:hypothetical protein